MELRKQTIGEFIEWGMLLGLLVRGDSWHDGEQQVTQYDVARWSLKIVVGYGSVPRTCNRVELIYGDNGYSYALFIDTAQETGICGDGEVFDMRLDGRVAPIGIAELKLVDTFEPSRDAQGLNQEES
jgi:hypothetical protein